MKKLVFLTTIFLLVGCTPSAETVQEDLSPVVLESGLEDKVNKIENIEYEIAEEKDEDGYYLVDVIVTVSKDFDKYNLEEKFNILSDVSGNIESEGILPDCGGPDCDFGDFIVKSDSIHTIPFPVYDVKVLGYEVDGKSYSIEELHRQFTPEDYAHEEIVGNGVQKISVYEFMKNAYDEITDYGANYVPEIHDPQVAELAAEYFGVTPDEASDIYIQFETGQLQN
ncbi:hypothetical protein NVV31_22995 [Cytobacillus firmus]|uniref:hypothetical protein n=1 Tax=Cytobacillus firmus TaxID=1399 RepID=UPI0021CAAB7F|nr:hypothetical protein [Cytobacillus firmus]MCU1808241.1 hypothetical protein [Cytobacillus firmus]